MIEIRRATADDAPGLARLRWEFRAAKGTPIEDREQFLERCTSWMRAELEASATWQVWTAVDAGEVVGQLWLRTIEKLPNPVDERERLAYLSNLYVTPAARGGVGTALLNCALEWAGQAGVERIVLWPTSGSRPLYVRHGFSDRVECLELRLPDRDEEGQPLPSRDD
jgi:predicted N-acetyltransferase YhbS